VSVDGDGRLRIEEGDRRLKKFLPRGVKIEESDDQSLSKPKS